LQLIDNLSKMRRLQLLRRPVSLRKHRNKKLLELLPSKLHKKLLPILLLLNLKLINKEPWQLKLLLKKLKELHRLLKEHLF